MFQNLFTFISDFLKYLELHSTFILVIITAIYAYITYKMTKIMSSQLEVDVKLSNIKLGTCLKEKGVKEALKTNSEQLPGTFNFTLCADVLNKGAGNCSISKPCLILNFPDGKEFEIKPKSKEVEQRKISDEETKEIVTDFGNTIYLKSRDFINIELDYRRNSSENFVNYVKNNLKNIKYFIEYVDNLETKHRLAVENIYATNEVKRY